MQPPLLAKNYILRVVATTYPVPLIPCLTVSVPRGTPKRRRRLHPVGGAFVFLKENYRDRSGAADLCARPGRL